MFFKATNVIRSGANLIIFLCFSLSSQVVFSHHSAAMFDLEKTVVIEGTVEKFQWTNPHVWLHINTIDKAGKSVTWKIEHVSPNILKRQGWKRNSFKKGDEVKVTFYPVKSGAYKGGFIHAVTANGTELGKLGKETHPELIEGDEYISKGHKAEEQNEE